MQKLWTQFWETLLFLTCFYLMCGELLATSRTAGFRQLRSFCWINVNDLFTDGGSIPFPTLTRRQGDKWNLNYLLQSWLCTVTCFVNIHSLYFIFKITVSSFGVCSHLLLFLMKTTRSKAIIQPLQPFPLLKNNEAKQEGNMNPAHSENVDVWKVQQYCKLLFRLYFKAFSRANHQSNVWAVKQPRPTISS